jgi:hypothetical protein
MVYSPLGTGKNLKGGSGHRHSHFPSHTPGSTKGVVKAGQLKHKPGLILYPGQPEVAWVTPKDLVAIYQSRQPMAVDKGHIFEIDHDPLDASLGQVSETLDDVF